MLSTNAASAVAQVSTIIQRSKGVITVYLRKQSLSVHQAKVEAPQKRSVQKTHAND
jgi:hypothetical protein